MDATRFDDLLRAVVASSRRAVLVRALGTLLSVGAVASAPRQTLAKKKKKKPKRKPARCGSGQIRCGTRCVRGTCCLGEPCGSGNCGCETATDGATFCENNSLASLCKQCPSSGCAPGSRCLAVSCDANVTAVCRPECPALER